MSNIPTIQLIRTPDSSLILIDPLAPSAIANSINAHNRSPLAQAKLSEALWEEFLCLQLKPRTRQEYAKVIDYFCRFGVANAARSMSPQQPPATFLSEFLKLSGRQAILMVLEWRQRLLDEGKASATINLRIT
jgi:hypothetical protein